MALTVARETTPQGGNCFPGSDGKTYERWKITGDGAGGNADIALAAGRVPLAVRQIPGNGTPAASAYAATLSPSATVDVRIVVPSSLASGKYIYAEVEFEGV